MLKIRPKSKVKGVPAINLQLPIELKTALEVEAKRTGYSQIGFVRQLLTQYFEDNYGRDWADELSKEE